MFKCSRILAGMLAVSLLFSGSAAATTFDSAFSYSYAIGDTARYTRLEGVDSGGLQKANYIEYTPNSSVKPVITYADDTLYGSKASITNAASHLQNQGYQVLGGVNADFFVLGTSIPLGVVIKDGRLISSDAWQAAVGFRADGSAVLGQPQSTMSLAGASGTVWISYFNKTRTSAGIYLLNSDFDDQTHISTNGRSIILERLDDTPVTLGGTVKMKVIAKGAGSGSTTITPNQMVLTMDDRCKATWVDYPVGEEVTLTVNTSDSKWMEVDFAVGGKSLIQNGTVSTSGIDGGSSRAPRTAVAVKDDGTVMLYEIDGRQSSHSVGLTAAQLAAELQSLGYNNAICLDGGGSSALNVRIPGENDLSLVSKPSDGSPRACANYIFLVNQATSDGVAKHIHMRPSTYYVLPGASTYFAAWASDNAYAPASLPSDITYTASSGTVDSAERIFQSDASTSGAVTITGTSSDGSVTGSHAVCVTPAVNSIQLKSGEYDVSSVSLRGGHSTDLDAVLYHQGMQMASSDALLNWTVSGDIGTIDENGVFTANENPASGKITCSYGNVSASVAVTVGLSNPQELTPVADFDTAQPFTASDGTTLTQVTDYAAVARGTGALEADVQEDTAELTLPAVTTTGLSVLSFLAKADTTDLTLTARFADASGEVLTAPLSGTISDRAYSQFSTTIPENAVSFIGLQITNANGHKLWLDHMIMSQRLVNHTDAPVISLQSAPETVEAGASATVTAKITMESGKYTLRPQNVTAYVDGAKSSAVYSAESASIAVPTGALAAGLHQVTIEAVDDAGNRSRVSVPITAGSSTTSSFTDTAGNWANGYINFAAARGLIKGETKNGANVFNPQRNLTRNEFAVIMARYLGLDTSDAADLPFADAARIPSWSAGAIKACYMAGVMNGQLDTKTNQTRFNPDANITRVEVMTVIAKCLPRGYVASATSFTDQSSIAAWADPFVRYTVATGIITGYADGSIKPNNHITRAEISKVLSGLY